MDNIVAVGASIDVEDIILYTLNEIPSQYNAFKTAIRTKLTPVSLADLYSLLISEKINLATKCAKENRSIPLHVAMYVIKGKKQQYGYKNKRSKCLKVHNEVPNLWQKRTHCI